MIRLLFWLHRGWLAPGRKPHAFFARHCLKIRAIAFVAALLLFPLFAAASWLRIGLKKLFFRKPSVLFAPTPIISIVEESALLRRLGYDSKTLVYTVYFITDKFDYNLKELLGNPAIVLWMPTALFLWALLRFDIFHFFYDGGLWSGMKIVPPAKWIEFPLLRLAGKRIVASAYGSDVRVRALNEMWQPHNLCRECPEPGKHCICDPTAGLKNANYHLAWCNELLAMGDMHDCVFGSRVDFVYWPIDVQAVEYVGAKRREGPVRIAHSPNHRHFKGTRYIEAAVSSLKAKGYDVELDIIERVPNDEAKRRYAAADIIAAQCVAGWCGFTEIEGMAAGKPVMGYIRSPKYLAHTPDCPLVSADPDRLEAEMERLVADAALREDLGRRGRQYVEKYWSYEALGPHYRRLHQQMWWHNGLCAALRRQWRRFFRGDTGYRVGKTLRGHLLGEWTIWSDPFLNLARIESGCYGQPPFDDRGIPRMMYNGQYVEHPGVVALYAINHLHAGLARPGEAKHQAGFRRAAEWLRDHLHPGDDGVARWTYPFDCVGRKLTAGWCSCFSQSLGLSVLLRAEQRWPEAGFGERIDAAAELFRLPVRQGGVLWEEDGKTFLEEYPEDPPAHVLNGMVTGMFGLDEYYRATGKQWAKDLFDRVEATLRRTLLEYETPAGLRYDLVSPAVVNYDYYYFIVQQLWALEALSGVRFYGKVARRWRRALYRLRLKKFWEQFKSK